MTLIELLILLSHQLHLGTSALVNTLIISLPFGTGEEKAKMGHMYEMGIDPVMFRMKA